MPRRESQFSPASFYHIYNRGNNRQKIFFETENYRFFLQKLRSYLDPHDINLLAYCLMPNHYHLVIRLEQKVDFSNIMRSFSVSYVKSVNKVYRRVGHLFQGNFEGREVDADEYLAHLVRYIHFNPVRGRLVTRPEDWKYSDYVEWCSDSGRMDAAKKKVRTRLFGTPGEYRTFCQDLCEELEMRAKLEELLFSR